jgi:hypothetical protein
MSHLAAQMDSDGLSWTVGEELEVRKSISSPTARSTSCQDPLAPGQPGQQVHVPGPTRPSPSRPRLPRSSSRIRRRVARRASRCCQGLAARLGRSVRCRPGRRPRRACDGCLQHRLRLVPAAHAAAPSFSPGAARSGIARGPVPSRPVIPGPRPSPSWEGPVHGSCPGPGMGKRRARQVRRSNHLAGSSSGHNE